MSIFIVILSLFMGACNQKDIKTKLDKDSFLVPIIPSSLENKSFKVSDYGRRGDLDSSSFDYLNNRQPFSYKLFASDFLKESV